MSTAEYTGFSVETVSVSSEDAPGMPPNRSAAPLVRPAPMCAVVMPVRFLNALAPTSVTESGRMTAFRAPS